MNTLYYVSPPGFLVTFAYSLAVIMYCWVNPRRFSAKKTLLIQGAGMVLINVLAFLLESPDIRFYFLRMIFFYCLLMGLMALCMRGPFARVLYFFPFVMVLGEFVMAVDWHLYYYGVTVNKIPDILPIRLPFLFGYYCGFTFLAYLANRRFREYNSAMEFGLRDILQPWILAVFSLIISNVSNFLPVSPISSQVPGQIFLIRLLVDATGLTMLYLFHTMRFDIYKSSQMEMLNRSLEMQYANYNVLKQSVELVAGNYHDLKHQIQFLESERPGEEKQRFLDKLKNEMSDFEAQANTGSEMLDTIVMSKRMLVKKDGIELTCIADGAQLSFLDPMDLSALFGNLLDNAVEAVRKIDDPEERLIKLTVERQKGFVLILCENCFTGTLEMQSGIPKTTKTDAFFHGYGTKSISSIARKYSGSAVFSAQDGWFRAKILLPADKTE